ncbi:unnamed protein product [Toxocara canis]|uniref:Uncharacterized protein n=1 Tax=Toxocara canis TaxID=6265 RepID=A0A183VFK0_TOXCA|nr:unnamed protein product [Toxocara canis]
MSGDASLPAVGLRGELVFCIFTLRVMDITLTRVDYAQIGTASKGCMRVIAADKDEKKKKTRSLDKVNRADSSADVVVVPTK